MKLKSFQGYKCVIEVMFKYLNPKRELFTFKNLNHCAYTFLFADFSGEFRSVMLTE